MLFDVTSDNKADTVVCRLIFGRDIICSSLRNVSLFFLLVVSRKSGQSISVQLCVSCFCVFTWVFELWYLKKWWVYSLPFRRLFMFLKEVYVTLDHKTSFCFKWRFIRNMKAE